MKSLVAGIALFAASVAWADAEPLLSRERLISEKGSYTGRGLTAPPSGLVAKPGREIAPPSGLIYDLPSEAATPSGKLTVTVRNGARVYAEETIVLPAAFTEAPTIAFLGHHPNELARMRKAASARPQAVRFTIALGDKVIVDVPFVDADRGSARLAEGGSVVGSTRSVTVKLRDPMTVATNGMEPDPACAADCEQAFFDCYTYCDERGAGCPWCQEQYTDCLWYCPQVCYEPKDVVDAYGSWTYNGSINHGTICINYTSAYILWEDFFRRAKYERTIHCNDTYTDVFVGYEYASSYCKEYVAPGCSGNFYNPPPNC